MNEDAESINAPDRIWADDLIGRKGDADFLENFLVGRMAERREAERPGSYVLNVDAPWGAGKTFFLERFGRQLEQSGHIVARVNAWRDDHLDDPFVAVLAAIDSALEPYTKKDGKASKLWKAVKGGATPILGRAAAGAAKTLVKRYVGQSMDELIRGEDADKELTSDGVERSAIEEVIADGTGRISVEIERVIDQSAQKLVDAFNAQAKSSNDFRAKLESAVEALKDKKKLPLFVLIDELDRCRPSYAIALLERVKHIFDANNLVFVFATNSGQLQHSVSGAYGAGFDGFRYLKRFFDRTYNLDLPSVDDFVRAEAEAIDFGKARFPTNNAADFLALASMEYAMDLREVQHVIDIIGTVISAWPHQPPVDLVILVPLAVQFYRTGKLDWDEAIGSIPSSFKVSRRAWENWQLS